MSSELTTGFKAAADRVKALSKTPSNDDLLMIYALFKQANNGDIPPESTKPGMFSPKEAAKWEKWNSLKGTSKEDAMRKYIELVEKLEKA